MTDNPLHSIAQWRDRPGPSGIPSICTAHPLAIEAAMRSTLPTPLPLLIEATCNQVNQDGGYTGMTPADFRRFVHDIAARVGFPPDRLILGGDHLGPNPWKDLPAEQAMDKAEVMIRAYAAAGFTKLHLDCSMGCAGEPVALDDAETATRAARLAAAAEAARPAGGIPPVYIIGTEVPIPGGAMEEIEGLEVTRPAPGGPCVSDRFLETLPNGVTHDVLDIGTTDKDNRGVFAVPAGHLFFMGDNRDNSTDSRFPQAARGVGMVPVEDLVGRADRIVFSSAGRSMLAFWTWRGDRFFRAIQ